ncbi:MAG: hypothetical protein JOZ08_20035 [Verrucomicrobia bacterium]|nr:hypothetical protein [Verrucomicrobiota bacterium]
MISNQTFSDELTIDTVARRDTAVRARYHFGSKVQNADRLVFAAETLITDPLITDYFGTSCHQSLKPFYIPPLTNTNQWPLLN